MQVETVICDRIKEDDYLKSMKSKESGSADPEELCHRVVKEVTTNKTLSEHLTVSYRYCKEMNINSHLYFFLSEKR